MPETRRPHVPTLASMPLEKDSVVGLPRIDASSSFDETYGDQILLTPPPQNTPANPLESLTFSPARLDVLQAQNHYTYSENRQRPTSSGHDAHTMFNGLHIRTDMPPPRRSASTHSVESEGRLRSSASAASLPRRVPSIRSHLHSTAGSLSPGSVISSPQLAAMLDVTPLPSPTMAAFESWKTVIRTRSRTSSTSSRTELPALAYPPFSPSSPRKKGYQSLKNTPNKSSTSAEMLTDESRERTRSISEYVPEALTIPKPRHVAVSGSGPDTPTAAALHREEYLGERRGIASPLVQAPPAIPRIGIEPTHEEEPAPKRPKLETFTANSISTGQVRRYESIRLLGQGTFSRVYLAVRQTHDRVDTVDYSKDSVNMAGVRARSRRLAAVKVVEHGPAGGADAERIGISLKREVEILKAIKHPSVVHLKAFGNDPLNRALLVMNYCPGGDLFDVASTKLEILTPPLVRRIFSELVSAVRYLHQKYIVHRDIKLESR